MNSIISLADIKPQNITLCNKGLFIDEKRYFIKIENATVIFAGDNKKFESDPTKVKNSVKFKLNNPIDNRILKCIADKGAARNLFYTDDDMFTVYLTDKTKVFDMDKNEIDNDVTNLRGCNINLLVNPYIIDNKFGRFERMSAYQVKINSKEEKYAMFDECQI